MKRIDLLRCVAVAEGISFLVLLGIAMPLKYVWHWPLGVRVVGMAHGVLFIAFVLLVILAARRQGWRWGFTLWAFLSSLLPAGTFVLDWQLKQREARQA